MQNTAKKLGERKKSIRNSQGERRRGTTSSKHRIRDSAAAHREGHSGTDMHAAAHEGPLTGAGGYFLKQGEAHKEPMLNQIPDSNCSLRRGSHTGAAFLAGPEAHEGPMLAQSFSVGLQPMERTHNRAGAKSKQEEEQKATVVDGPQAPIHHPLFCLVGRV